MVFVSAGGSRRRPQTSSPTLAARGATDGRTGSDRRIVDSLDGDAMIVVDTAWTKPLTIPNHKTIKSSTLRTICRQRAVTGTDGGPACGPGRAAIRDSPAERPRSRSTNGPATRGDGERDPPRSLKTINESESARNRGEPVSKRATRRGHDLPQVKLRRIEIRCQTV